MKNGFESGMPRSPHEVEKKPFDFLGGIESELVSALSLFWTAASRILEGSGVKLLAPPTGYFDLERNFFSALFLYSYHRADISASRRGLYAAINQCLRGIVTGCDNLLDDEYKKTLETDLPPEGIRFRSVLDILTSDRVLFDILFHAHRRNQLSADDLLTLNALSLKTLVRSGAQEASEETGIRARLKPEAILRSVHHYKTGLLFQSPWAAPSALENLPEEITAPILKALHDIGMGCQIMDDMVDLRLDLKERRHNYILSLIHHDPDPETRKLLNRLAVAPDADDPGHLPNGLAHIRASAAETALDYLNRGLGGLFCMEPPSRISAAIGFLAGKIGAEHWLFPEKFSNRA